MSLHAQVKHTRKYFFLKNQFDFLFEGLVSEDKRSWYDFVEGSLLYILVNCDLTFHYPKPLFPNVVSVEGLSITEPKPLRKGQLIFSLENVIG